MTAWRYSDVLARVGVVDGEALEIGATQQEISGLEVTLSSIDIGQGQVGEVWKCA